MHRPMAPVPLRSTVAVFALLPHHMVLLPFIRIVLHLLFNLLQLAVAVRQPILPSHLPPVLLRLRRLKP